MFAVQFGDAVRLKAVRCENACFEECNKEVFIASLPLATRSCVRIFLSHELEAHLKKLAQHVENLLHQKHVQVKESQMTPRRFRGKKRSRREAIVANVERSEK